MKSKLTLLVAFYLVLSLVAFSQAPNLIKYLSMVRKTDGSALVNQSVKVKISILAGSSMGATVYSETHALTSNAFGIVNLNIGEGSEKFGSISTIDWSSNSYFVKIEIDETGGTNFTLSNVSQLLSVPYALYANSSGSSIPGPKGDIGLTGAKGSDGLTTSVNGVTQVGGAITLTKTDIGLANVDNTSDANKTISTATQTALNRLILFLRC